MDKVEKSKVVEEFVEFLMDDLNSWIGVSRTSRNKWLDEKLKEYKKMIYK